MASSIASFVPEPMEKCAEALASPSSSLLPMTQRLLRIIGKLRQIERLVRNAAIAEEPAEDLFHERRRFSLALVLQPRPLEGLRIGLKHPGRAVRFRY